MVTYSSDPHISAAASTVLNMTLMGAPIACFGWAAVGSVLSYSWGDPEKNKRLLVFKVTSTTVFSVAAAVVLPDLTDWDIQAKSVVALSFFISMFARWLIPAIRHALPAMARGAMETIGRAIGSKSPNPQDYADYPQRQPGDRAEYERYSPNPEKGDERDQGY